MRATSSDRLGFTLVLSVTIHLILLLGVSFNVFSPPTNTPVNNLEITLVKQQDNFKPEEADFLAQANNEGGGELETPSPTPTPDLPIEKVDEEPASEQLTSPQKAPQTIDMPKTEIPPVVAPQSEPEPVVDMPAPEKPKEPTPKPPTKAVEKTLTKAVTQTESEHKVQQVETPGEAIETKAEAPKKVSAKELMLRAHNEIQRLEEKFDENRKTLNKRPKKRRISASTKEYSAAAYMDAWEKKVERIGNMNYPQEAKRKGLNGSLMLSVDINPDGSVPPGGIVISRSSGHKVLDDAAVKIVRLGAPYAAIPKDVLRSNDMLTIIRTWKFETNRGLSTR